MLAVVRGFGIAGTLLLFASLTWADQPTDEDYVKGHAALDNEDYAKALAHFEILIRRYPQFTWGYQGRGRAYLGKNNYDLAIQDFNTCLQQNIQVKTNKSILHVDRGLAYLYKKDNTQAIADFDEALRLDPNNGEASNYRKKAEKQRNQGPESESGSERSKAIEIPIKGAESVALPARFVIRVPPHADVEIEGVKMKQAGAERHFRSPPLRAGNSYAYEVKASWQEDGKDISVREKVRVSPGAVVGLDFRPERRGGVSPGPVEKRPAILLIRVPDDARLELEGARTNQKGELRRFETQPLELGGKYRYTVKAAWKENGQDVVREQIISFRPGEETTVDLRRPAPTGAEKSEPGR